MMTLEDIMREVRALTVDQRKQLISLIVDSIAGPENEKTHSILEFEGIAAHQADDVDPQSFIDRLRNEWDERL